MKDYKPYYPKEIQLNNRLKKIGNPFVVGVWTLPNDIEIPDVNFYHHVIREMFEKKILPERKLYREKSIHHYEEMITQDLSNSNLKIFKKHLNHLKETVDFANVENALPRTLNNQQIIPLERLKSFHTYKNLSEEDWFLTLYWQFNDPPYRLKIDDVERKNLWQNFCEVTGLNVADNVQVLDWIRHLTSYSYESNYDMGWSNYFEDGLEWWGVWCLTVFNPRLRTVSVILASTTD